MKTSQDGIDLIKRFEGLELEAYQDIAGIWTIGYGHTGEDLERCIMDADAGIEVHTEWYSIKDGKVTISDSGAEAKLRRDLEHRENRLNGWAIHNGVDLNQNEFDALISFIFNVGFAAFRGSTAARWLREGKPREQVAEALTWWNKARVNGKLVPVEGLIRRRAAEAQLFLSYDTSQGAAIADTPQTRRLSAQGLFDVDALTTRNFESGARPEKEQRPLITYLPIWRAA